MQLTEAILQALQTVWSHKLRSFFTLLGIIVSVAFLIAVVAVIQGMNAYVRERLAGAIVGVNAFQIRRDPIQVGFIDDLAWSRIQRRPIIAPQDVPYVERAIPDAQAIALQSGWPTPTANVAWRNRTIGDAFVFGVTAPYQIVQDYQIAAGDPLTDVDVQQRRLVAILGYDVAEKLFEDAARAVGQRVRIRGWAFTIKGVIAKKGTVLGQSWDGFVMLVLSSIGLMVGGVGVVAIMMISVTERTREIGVRKALGATRRAILWQFLVEASTLTLVGGAAGMLVGGGVAFAISRVTPIPANVPLWSIVVALGASALTGVGFGLYPASRAARLDPVEALRYE